MTPDIFEAPEVKELPATKWSEEHECLPLKLRLKMLQATALSINQQIYISSSISPIVDFVKMEDHFTTGILADQEQIQHATLHAIDDDTMLLQRVDVDDTNAQHVFETKISNCQNISDDFLDDLDHIVLKERRRILLLREYARSSGLGLKIEHNSTQSCTNSVDMNLQNAEIGSGGRDTCGIQYAIGGNDIFQKCAENVSVSCEALESGSFNSTTSGAPTLANQHQRTALTESQNRTNAITENCLLSDSVKTGRTLALPYFQNVKSEPFVDELEIPNNVALNTPSCLGNKIYVKSEHVNNYEIYEDIIDHLMLGDRMRLLASKTFSNTILYEDIENSKTFVPSGKPFVDSPKALVIKRPRKRRRTVTDSVEIALEEDVPGLLQVLINKGILVDEIKLYGEPEGDEALDESLVEESFSELEDVITKIFSQRQSLIKLPPTRCVRGEKTRYCLACLISLVEQAHFLRVKKWPVEWGWCRDLQSFIFVFEKHNRIVLERPEYGYATYFFELVDSLPVQWQIKRLVTSMKLTSCGRITLIENRALMVGEDLTEGEARVLMEYGWIPNSGLGTMLNYRDRVVHDRKNDDRSEWRSKIGNLLTDGFNGGAIVLNDIPNKVFQYGIGQSSRIKLEH